MSKKYLIEFDIILLFHKMIYLHMWYLLLSF